MNTRARSDISLLTYNKTLTKESIEWIDKIYKHLEKACQRICRQKSGFRKIEIEPGKDAGELVKSLQTSTVIVLPVITSITQPGDLMNYLTQLLELLDGAAINILAIENHPSSKEIPFENVSQRYPMYSYNTASDEYTALSPDNDPASYWSRITDMGYDIARSMISSSSVTPSDPRKTIYVSEAIESIESERAQLIRELKQQNIRILPERPLKQGDDLEGQILHLMEMADIIIEMVGEYEDDDILTEVQHELAARINQNRVSEPLLPRIIWINPIVKSHGDSYLSFIEKMQKGGEHMRGAEVVQAPIEILKSVLRKIMEEGRTDENKEKKVDNGDIYLVHDRHDNELAGQVKGMLESSGLVTVDPWLVDDMEGLYKNHKRYLTSINGLLVIYSGNNATWLSGKLRDILKAPGYGRSHPFVACAVLNVSQEVIQQAYGIEVIQAKSDPSSLQKELGPFIEKIKENHGK